MLLLPWLHGEGWGLWTLLIPPGFGPLGRWGAGSPWARPPPVPWSVFTCPAPCSLQPRPLPAGRLRLLPGDCPLPGGAQRGPPGFQVVTGGLEQPGEGWGHRWPFSLSGFSKGYSPGWAPCLLLLSDTNSCHGWVWDGIALQGTHQFLALVHAGAEGRWGTQMGHGVAPSWGVSLCQIPSPGSPARPHPHRGLR